MSAISRGVSQALRSSTPRAGSRSQVTSSRETTAATCGVAYGKDSPRAGTAGRRRARAVSAIQHRCNRAPEVSSAASGSRTAPVPAPSRAASAALYPQPVGKVARTSITGSGSCPAVGVTREVSPSPRRGSSQAAIGTHPANDSASMIAVCTAASVIPARVCSSQDASAATVLPAQVRRYSWAATAAMAVATAAVPPGAASTASDDRHATVISGPTPSSSVHDRARASRHDRSG